MTAAPAEMEERLNPLHLNTTGSWQPSAMHEGLVVACAVCRDGYLKKVVTLRVEAARGVPGALRRVPLKQDRKRELR
jgi:hypothetical protein